jgi:hypothetical protein
MNTSRELMRYRLEPARKCHHKSHSPNTIPNIYQSSNEKWLATPFHIPVHSTSKNNRDAVLFRSASSTHGPHDQHCSFFPPPTTKMQKGSESFLISQTGNRTPASGGLSHDKPKY